MRFPRVKLHEVVVRMVLLCVPRALEQREATEVIRIQGPQKSHLFVKDVRISAHSVYPT